MSNTDPFSGHLVQYRRRCVINELLYGKFLRQSWHRNLKPIASTSSSVVGLTVFTLWTLERECRLPGSYTASVDSPPKCHVPIRRSTKILQPRGRFSAYCAPLRGASLRCNRGGLRSVCLHTHPSRKISCRITPFVSKNCPLLL